MCPLVLARCTGRSAAARLAEPPAVRGGRRG